MMQTLLKKCFVTTLPVMAGYLFLGTGFGMLLQSKGYGFLWAVAMSGFIYAGSMQYLAIDLLCGGASLITAAITTLMVNARHLFYGISMIDAYQDTGIYKPYLIFALTDETYSLNCGGAPEDVKNPKLYYFLVSLFNQCYWVTGSALGVLVGTLLPVSTEGIDFALTALFVTVFVEQWKSTQDHIPALIGVVCSLVCVIAFGPGSFLIPAMILITIALTLYRGNKEGLSHA